jgi:chaperonin cofactor prefoldin
MHAALIAIAGSAITFSVLSTTKSPAQFAPQAATTASLATTDASKDAIPTDDFAFAAGGTVDLRTATLASLFEQIRENIDRPLVIHWNHLEDIGITKDQPLDMDADPVPTQEALRLAIARTGTPDFGGITIIDGPEVVEVTTNKFQDLRTKQIRPHDIAGLVSFYEVPRNNQSPFQNSEQSWRSRQTAELAGREVLDAIIQLVSREDWVDRGGELASARVVGNSLVIDAPARIHAGVEEVIMMMEAEVAKYQAQQREAHEEMVESKRQHLNQLVDEMDSLAAELNMLNTQRTRKEYESESLQAEIRKLGYAQVHPEMAKDHDPAEIEALNLRRREVLEKLADIAAHAHHFQSEIEDKRAYRNAVRDRLIELKYEPVMIERAQAVERGRRNQERREQAEATRRSRNN